MAQEMNKERRIYTGTVISDKMDKTVVVKTERMFVHKGTAKTMRSFKTYKVHDEQENAKIGDLVEFYEGRPVSKTKYMYLKQVIKAAAGQE